VERTTATHLQLPYDPQPPPGVKPGAGISIEAVFTGPDGAVSTQPAFYFQEFLDETRGGRAWFYPTGRFSWKVRFAPPQPGVWQYRLRASDAGGAAQTGQRSFPVTPSANHGFVRVSASDPRYFEFEDGTYFPALGYNLNYDHLSWDNPVQENEPHFRRMAANGIQLARIWLTQWGIYGSAWNQWRSATAADQYVPFTSLTYQVQHPESEISMALRAGDEANPCMFLGFAHPPPAVKRNTDYHVSIRYRADSLLGPRLAGQPFGFVAKIDSGKDCADPRSGEVVTPYAGSSAGEWHTLEGNFNSEERDFVKFYLAVENAIGGTVYVDRVEVRERLPDGLGSNIITRPSMDHHLYMEQRNSYAFDRALELAERYGITLRPVILEKQDWIFQRIHPDGRFAHRNPDHFYGDFRQVTKTRWLQMAWWRYLQARWGYSTSIHSWELLNEGSPSNPRHWALADEFGRYMRQFAPNKHPVSTSTWHSFPVAKFWSNEAYAFVDFADVHQYVEPGSPEYGDTALATYQASLTYGALGSAGPGKPVIRGETGFGDSRNIEILKDRQGIWLHNFIWGGINPGGLIESYWYDDKHIYRLEGEGAGTFDHRDHYGAYYRFIRDIPLNNGNYRDARAMVADQRLRAWGQLDPLAGKAHLWIQNKDHTWKNVIAGRAPPGVSGQVSLAGFAPDTEFRVEWWDTYRGRLDAVGAVFSDAEGTITLEVRDLATDTAVRIGDYRARPSLGPAPKNGR
jgi:hypothetical protein